MNRIASKIINALLLASMASVSGNDMQEDTNDYAYFVEHGNNTYVRKPNMKKTGETVTVKRSRLLQF